MTGLGCMGWSWIVYCLYYKTLVLLALSSPVNPPHPLPLTLLSPVLPLLHSSPLTSFTPFSIVRAKEATSSARLALFTLETPCPFRIVRIHVHTLHFATCATFSTWQYKNCWVAAKLVASAQLWYCITCWPIGDKGQKAAYVELAVNLATSRLPYLDNFLEAMLMTVKQSWADANVSASSRIRREGILMTQWAKTQQCWKDANLKDETCHRRKISRIFKFIAILYILPFKKIRWRSYAEFNELCHSQCGRPTVSKPVFWVFSFVLTPQSAVLYKYRLSLRFISADACFQTKYYQCRNKNGWDHGWCW